MICVLHASVHQPLHYFRAIHAADYGGRNRCFVVSFDLSWHFFSSLNSACMVILSGLALIHFFSFIYLSSIMICALLQFTTPLQLMFHSIYVPFKFSFYSFNCNLFFLKKIVSNWNYFQFHLSLIFSYPELGYCSFYYFFYLRWFVNWFFPTTSSSFFFPIRVWSLFILLLLFCHDKKKILFYSSILN